VEHGDLNWITKKFIAFASPKERPTTHGMYPYDNQGNMGNMLQSDINTTSQQWFRNTKDVKMGNKKVLYPANTVDGIVKYFKENGVTCVVRLNNKLYDNRKFLEAGINHYEFYFPDGTIPPDNILFRFFDLCETSPGKKNINIIKIFIEKKFWNFLEIHINYNKFIMAAINILIQIFLHIIII